MLLMNRRNQEIVKNESRRRKTDAEKRKRISPHERGVIEML